MTPGAQRTPGPGQGGRRPLPAPGLLPQGRGQNGSRAVLHFRGYRPPLEEMPVSLFVLTFEWEHGFVLTWGAGSHTC